MKTNDKKTCQNSAARGRRPVVISSVLPIGVDRIDGSRAAWTEEGSRKLGAFVDEDVLVRAAPGQGDEP